MSAKATALDARRCCAWAERCRKFDDSIRVICCRIAGAKRERQKHCSGP